MFKKGDKVFFVKCTCTLADRYKCDCDSKFGGHVGRVHSVDIEDSKLLVVWVIYPRQWYPHDQPALWDAPVAFSPDEICLVKTADTNDIDKLFDETIGEL